MRMSHAQLARDARDLEDAFKRDYNQLRRKCVVLDKMKEDICQRREELEWRKNAIVKKVEVNTARRKGFKREAQTIASLKLVNSIVRSQEKSSKIGKRDWTRSGDRYGITK